jgi:hypothetical protein
MLLRFAGAGAAHEPTLVHECVFRSAATSRKSPALSIHEIVERRAAFLGDYQNDAYAERYRPRIAPMQAAEELAVPGSSVVAEAATRNLFKLMAIKDVYEVARLFSDGAIHLQQSAEFDGFDKLEFHLSLPMLARRDELGRTELIKRDSLLRFAQTKRHLGNEAPAVELLLSQSRVWPLFGETTCVKAELMTSALRFRRDEVK